MHIIINGVYRKNKKILKSATEFYADKLISKRMQKNISVLLEHDNDLVKDNMGGFCEWIEENIRPRNFLISLNCKQPMDELLISLAHEMVHVKQFVSEELKHRIRNRTLLWNNVVIDPDQYLYADLPWEVEAYHKEEILYEQYRRQYQSL